MVKNLARASALTRQAARRGYPAAQYVHALALLVRRPPEESEAVRWLKRAAVQENADAQYMLGVMLGEGREIQKDMAESLGWLQKSARNGHSGAIDLLRRANVPTPLP